MGSSEVVASGRVRPGAAAFSLTCNRLSRYLKEKGGFGDVGLVLTPRQNMESKGTMNLLPMIEKSNDEEEVVVKSDVSVIKAEAAKKAQMTIFYGGRVMMFEDLPAPKAVEIIMLAGKASASASRPEEERAAYSLPPPPLDSGIEFADVLGIRFRFTNCEEKVGVKVPGQEKRSVGINK